MCSVQRYISQKFLQENVYNFGTNMLEFAFSRIVAVGLLISTHFVERIFVGCKSGACGGNHEVSGTWWIVECRAMQKNDCRVSQRNQFMFPGNVAIWPFIRLSISFFFVIILIRFEGSNEQDVSARFSTVICSLNFEITWDLFYRFVRVAMQRMEVYAYFKEAFVQTLSRAVGDCFKLLAQNLTVYVIKEYLLLSKD